MKLESVISTYDESSDDENSKKGYRLQQKRQELDSEILRSSDAKKNQKQKLSPEEQERLDEERKKEMEKKKRQKKVLRAKRKRDSQLNAAKPSTQTTLSDKKQKPSEVYKRQNYTVSVAIPGSLLKRDQSEELKAHISFQIARTLALYRVDEIIVYNEEAKELDMKNFLPNVKARPPRKRLTEGEEEEQEAYGEGEQGGYGGYGYYEEEGQEQEQYGDHHQGESTNNQDESSSTERKQFRKRIVCDHNVFLANMLYYLDTPIYLRPKLFPHVRLFSSDEFDLPSLESSYHLLPLEFPHAYREGITVEGDCAYIGREKLVRLEQEGIPAGLRVTVETYSEDKFEYKGKVVSSSSPKENEGLYWGYGVRMANSLSEVFSASGYEEGYDLTVTTGDLNTGHNVDQPDFSLPSFKHMLVVFGGPEGLDKCIENDKKIVYGTDAVTLVDKVVNPVPHQGVRTIQSMEAIGLTLGALRAHIDYNVAPLETTGPRSFGFIKE